MRERTPFEQIVKAHVGKGKDVHSAFGRAINDDPESYARYLKRQAEEERRQARKVKQK